MQHPELNRIRLANSLGVAPDDIDYLGYMTPYARALLLAEDCEDEENWERYVYLESPREISAHERVAEIRAKEIMWRLNNTIKILSDSI